jgi:hypothetical protein
MKEDFKIWNVELVINTNVVETGSELLRKFEGQYDGNATLLPIPEGSPGKFPKLILPSSDGFRLNVTGESIAIHYNDNFANSEDALKRKFIKKVSETYQNNESRVNWIGLIIRHISKNQNSQDEIVYRNFTEPFNVKFNIKESEDIHIKFTKRKFDDLGKLDMFFEFGSNLIENNIRAGNIAITDINNKKNGHEITDISKFIEIAFKTAKENIFKLNG